ncbi:MAG: hypothetical protein KC736_04320 [Candidatus Moranbacteria bacterium]|nr:hypothetical protein [Candidatus Moranbacteria bacterium]
METVIIVGNTPDTFCIIHEATKMGYHPVLLCSRAELGGPATRVVKNVLIIETVTDKVLRETEAVAVLCMNFCGFPTYERLRRIFHMHNIYPSPEGFRHYAYPQLLTNTLQDQTQTPTGCATAPYTVVMGGRDFDEEIVKKLLPGILRINHPPLSWTDQTREAVVTNKKSLQRLLDLEKNNHARFLLEQRLAQEEECITMTVVANGRTVASYRPMHATMTTDAIGRIHCETTEFSSFEPMEKTVVQRMLEILIVIIKQTKHIGVLTGDFVKQKNGNILLTAVYPFPVAQGAWTDHGTVVESQYKGHLLATLLRSLPDTHMCAKKVLLVQFRQIMGEEFNLGEERMIYKSPDNKNLEIRRSFHATIYGISSIDLVSPVARVIHMEWRD